jgi:hypothetical protein
VDDVQKVLDSITSQSITPESTSTFPSWLIHMMISRFSDVELVHFPLRIVTYVFLSSVFMVDVGRVSIFFFSDRMIVTVALIFDMILFSGSMSCILAVYDTTHDVSVGV